MQYVDGYVLVVPKKSLKAYQKIASESGKIWRKCGALQYFECAGEDLAPREGMKMSFPILMQTKPTETVVFAFVIFKSRKHRDQVNAKVFKDPYMQEDNWKDKAMPFNMESLVYGGFQAIVEA